jgi:DNA-binding MarR family transcriptional regulator
MSRNETAQYELDVFKLCCRMLELHRRAFLAAEWKRHADIMPRGQFFNLMQIRFILPCNLSKIMELTGLTSAGASLFVDKLVQQGYLTRTDDPSDRRNVLIDVSAKGRELLSGVEDRLNEYISSYFVTCSAEELADVEKGMQVIYRKLT